MRSRGSPIGGPITTRLLSAQGFLATTVWLAVLEQRSRLRFLTFQADPGAADPEQKAWLSPVSCAWMLVVLPAALWMLISLWLGAGLLPAS